LSLDPVWCLHDQPDADATIGRSDQGLSDTRYPVDGIAHDRQSLRRRIDDFEDRLLGSPESSLLRLRAGPYDLDRFFVPVIVLALGCGQNSHGNGFGYHAGSMSMPMVEKVGGRISEIRHRYTLQDRVPSRCEV
jgi:hypothetical protein